MTKEEYKKEIDALFEIWKKEGYKHELYKKEGKRFSDDGIVDFVEWNKSTPKILFLLKEDYSVIDDYEPSWGVTLDSKAFSKNIARWRQIIKELFENSSKELSIENIVLPEKINDIALVEIKKLNEGNSSTPYNVMMTWAEEDKWFIKKQIEIINPDIIFCCYTGDAYANYLFNNNSWDELISIQVSWSTNPNKKCKCFKDNSRLVIDFYHPSTRNANDKELFEILCKMIKDGNVFEKFNWFKK